MTHGKTAVRVAKTVAEEKAEGPGQAVVEGGGASLGLRDFHREGHQPGRQAQCVKGVGGQPAVAGPQVQGTREMLGGDSCSFQERQMKGKGQSVEGQRGARTLDRGLRAERR